MVNFIKRNFKLISIVTIIGMVFYFIYQDDQQRFSNIPGYNLINESISNEVGNPQNINLELVSTLPENDSVMDSAYIKFEFTKPIKAEEFQVSINPNLNIKKEVKATAPNILWITPTNIWEEQVRYTITLKHKELTKDIMFYTTFFVPEPQDMPERTNVK